MKAGRRGIVLAVVTVAAVLHIGCGNPAGFPAGYPGFDDPYWRGAHETVLEVMDRFVQEERILARSATREWPDGVVDDDYTDIQPSTPEAWAALEQEVLAALQERLTPDEFLWVRRNINSEGLASRAAGGPAVLQIPGTGDISLSVTSWGVLLFWHSYDLVWDVIGNETPDTTIVNAIDAHTGQTIYWKLNPDDPQPVFTNAAEPYPRPLQSKWLAGNREQYHGFSRLTLTFYDAAISGGSLVWWPEIGDPLQKW